jgi:hypothetical protein
MSLVDKMFFNMEETLSARGDNDSVKEAPKESCPLTKNLTLELPKLKG